MMQARSWGFHCAWWLVAAVLVACGGGEDPSAGAGGSGGSGGGTSSAGGGDPTCPEPSKTASIGPEGGTLEHCGAKLEVPPGALSEAVEFGIAKIDPPGDPPFETEYTGGVFHFTPDDRDFNPNLGVFLPHGGAEGRIHFMIRAEGEWHGIEACEVTATHIQQSLSRLGTFAAVRDTITWPESTAGLGDGSLDYTFLGAMEQRTLVADEDGYAIYDQGQDGTRVYTLVFRKNFPDHLENLDIRINTPKDASPELIQVSYIDTSDPDGGYTYVSAIHSGGVVTITPSDDGRLKGTITTSLYKGEVAEPFEATFDVLAERFRYPPELACNNIPEG